MPVAEKEKAKCPDVYLEYRIQAHVLVVALLMKGKNNFKGK